MERRILVKLLYVKRNELIREGRYTDAIDELILRSLTQRSANMENIAKRLNAYRTAHPFNPGDSDCDTVLDQLYQAYTESHESDPPKIRDGFKELDALMGSLPLDDNNAVWNLCCQLCTAYEHKAFIDGLQYGAHLILELHK